jgi:hypothetical protein
VKVQPACESAGPSSTRIYRFLEGAQKRTNATHESSTDPQAKLMRKGNAQPAKLSFGAHALMENRSGLLIDVLISDSTLFEPKAAMPMLDRRRQACAPWGATRATTTKGSLLGSEDATFRRTWQESKAVAPRGRYNRMWCTAMS